MDQYTTTQAPPRNGFGITALVLALVGLVFGLVPFTGFIALILGGLAVLFGLLGVGRVSKGVATNKVMSWVGTVLGVAVAALGIWGMTILFGAVEQLDQDLQEISQGGEPAAPVVEQPAGPQPVEIEPGTIPEGTHVVGVDIEPGTYRTGGPVDSWTGMCYWERLSDASGSFESIIANGNPSGPTSVTIDPSDGAFSTDGCATWELVE